MQLKSNKSSPLPNKTREKNHLFYRFPALPSRINLLTLAPCFLIGLAIDCPQSHPPLSRWAITNKPSRKCWRTQKTLATPGLGWVRYFISIQRRLLLTLPLNRFFKSFQFKFKSSETTFSQLIFSGESDSGLLSANMILHSVPSLCFVRGSHSGVWWRGNICV